MMERLQHVMRTRGLGYEEIQVVTGGGCHRVADINIADLIELGRGWKRRGRAHRSSRKPPRRSSAPGTLSQAEWDACGGLDHARGTA